MDTGLFLQLGDTAAQVTYFVLVLILLSSLIHQFSKKFTLSLSDFQSRFLKNIDNNFFNNLFWGGALVLGGVGPRSLVFQMVNFVNSGLLRPKQALLITLGAMFGSALFVCTFIFASFHWGFVLIIFSGSFYLFLQSPRKKDFFFALMLLGVVWQLLTFIDSSMFRETWHSWLQAHFDFTRLILVTVFLSVVARSILVAIVFLSFALLQGVVGYKETIVLLVLYQFFSLVPVYWKTNNTRREVKKYVMGLFSIQIFQLIVGAMLCGFFWESLDSLVSDEQVSYVKSWRLLILSNLALVGATVVLSIPILFPILKWCDSWLASFKVNKKQAQKMQYIGETSSYTLGLSVEQVTQESLKMSAMVHTMLKLTKQAIDVGEDDAARSKVVKYEDITDNVLQEIKSYVNNLLQYGLYNDQTEKLSQLLFLAQELEYVADRCKTLCLNSQELNSNWWNTDGRKLTSLVLSSEIKFYEQFFENLSYGEPVNESQIRKFEERIKENLQDLAAKSQSEDSKSIFAVKLALAAVFDHTLNILENILRRDLKIKSLS